MKNNIHAANMFSLLSQLVAEAEAFEKSEELSAGLSAQAVNARFSAIGNIKTIGGTWLKIFPDPAKIEQIKRDQKRAEDAEYEAIKARMAEIEKNRAEEAEEESDDYSQSEEV